MALLPKFLRPSPPLSQKEVGGRSYQVIGFGDNSVSIKSNIGSLIDNGLKTNPILFAGVLKIVDSFIAAPMRSYDGEGLLDTKSELARFLTSAKAPNPDMTWGEVLHMTLIFHMLAGEAYWEKIRARGSKRVVEIWPLLPNRMRVIPGETSLIGSYIYDIGGRAYPLKPENIIRFPFPDPLEPQRGMSRISPALRSIETDNTLTQHVKQLTGNNAVPPVVITMPEGAQIPGETEKRRFLSRWIASYGPKGNNEPALVPHGTEIERIGLNLQELAFKELGHELETRILMTLGVPPIVVSAMAGLQHATKANAKELREMFHEDTISPKHRRFAEILNRYLAPEFGEGLFIKFDDSEVPAVVQQKIDRQKQIQAAYEVGIVTQNESREAWGFDRDPAGDVYKDGRKFGEEKNRQPDETEPADNRDDDDDQNAASKAVQRKAADLFKRKASWSRKDRQDFENLTSAGIRLSAAEEWAARFEDVTAGELAEQKRDVLEIVEAKTKAFDPTDADAILAALIGQGGPWAQRGAITYLPIMTDILGEAAGLASAEIGVSFDLDNEDARKFVESYSYTFAQKVSETTADGVRRAIRRALDEGASVSRLRQMIQSEVPEFGRERAQRIARTEVLRASNAGAVEAYRNAEIVRWEWLTTSDPCPYCAALNGKLVAIGEPVFALGDQFQPEGVTRPMSFNYTAIDHPPLHPNCRCTVIPDVEGEKGAGLPGAFVPVDENTTFKGALLSSGLIKLVNNFHGDLELLELQGFIHKDMGLWKIVSPESRNGTAPTEPEPATDPAGARS